MDHVIWTERYRPHTVADTILPIGLKKSLQAYVDEGTASNLLFAGPPGIGKTTAAMAILDELGADYIIKNASLEGNIDMLRTTLSQFASSVSIVGGRKYVILDEADYLTAVAQPALRTFIEEFSSNCGFIFTCNNKQRIIEALHSRLAVIDFRIPKSERATLGLEFYNRIIRILEENNVDYEKDAIIQVIKKHFPDWRRVLNELQHFSKYGKIDSSILSNFSDVTMAEMIKHLKEKSFTSMRKMLAENPDIEYTRFYRQLYDVAYDIFSPKFVAPFVVMASASMDQMSRSLDPEITLAAFLTEVMINAEWRE